MLEFIFSNFEKITVLIAAIWGYWRFLYHRTHEPALDIDIEVEFVGTQDDKWIIEVTTFLMNKSLVRVKYHDLQISVRYFVDDDPIVDGGAKILYQLECSRSIDERIEGNKRYFGNAEYINPNQEFRHRYITYVPIAATFVWTQAKLFFKIAKKHKVNTQRIFKVPANVKG